MKYQTGDDIYGEGRDDKGCRVWLINPKYDYAKRESPGVGHRTTIYLRLIAWFIFD